MDRVIGKASEAAGSQRNSRIRRWLVLVAATSVAMAGGTLGSVISLSTVDPGTARAADLASSRWARHISGFALDELTGGRIQGALAPAPSPVTSSPVAAPQVGTFGCQQVSNNNVRVNQDCTNNTSPPYSGRGQAKNETAIAVNPTNPQNLLAGQNDYRRGDGSCGADYSIDGGQHWGNTLLPISFSVPGIDNPGAARHYWTSSGDPSVAFDSRGAAYYTCMAFDRQFPVSDNGCTNPAGSCANGLFVFRSVDGGAAWTAPAGPTSSAATGQVIVTPSLVSTNRIQFNLEDKPYMAADVSSSSPFRDRIYVSWTHFAACSSSPSCETANIYFAYSNDHGATFSKPQNVSGVSSALCPLSSNPTTPKACDNNDYSEPFVAPNGDLYVVFRNFNNAFTEPDNFNDLLVVKSTDGGAHFGAPVLVSRFYDLPDCVKYTGANPSRGCVPTAPLSHVSVFRMANYPSAVADPTDPAKLYVTFGSYINPHSNSSNPPGHGFCAPNGLSTTTGLNLYSGVGDVNGCNNDILLSASTDGGRTWSSASTGPEHAKVVSDESGATLTDQFEQWAAITPSGQLAVSYYDRKYGDDQATGALDVSLAASDEEGFAHRRVTDIHTPPPTEFPGPNGYSLFMGDYNGLAVAGSTAYPLWTDSRNPQSFQCPSASEPLGLCRVTNGNVPGFNQDVFSTVGLTLPTREQER